MLRVRLGLAAGLLGIVVTLVVVLARPPLVLAGSNEVAPKFAITFTHGGETICQPGRTLPEGTEAIRVSLSPNIGPSVHLAVFAGSKVITEGERDPGWGVDETVTVSVRRVAHTAYNTRICTKIGPAAEGVQVNGERVAVNGGQAIWLRMEYLRPGPSSWLSLAPSIASRMGLAHAPAGAWVGYLAIAVMIAVSGFASRLVLRELG
ncbi:MAG TPA: hypothetical protein VNR42_03630 [Solirubrobacteraceae bacterium]|nr:hypothetical protein [Solirubrobacteraceae bacterium]